MRRLFHRMPQQPSPSTDLGPFITKTPRIIAQKHGYSFSHFDDFAELEQITKDFLQWQIIKIRFWYGEYAPTIVINGLQVTYRNYDTGETFVTSERYSRHLLQKDYEDIIFTQNELIQDVKARTGHVIDQLVFTTDKHRTITTRGGTGGEPNPFLLEEGKAVVGIHGATGDSFQEIGFYVAPIKEVRYRQKRTYVLMKAWVKAWVKSNPSVQEQVEKKMQEGIMKKEFKAELIFAAVVMRGDQLFAQVMRFL